jgi:hypothetical protein
LGEHAALYFEDAITMQYQVQEMLRLERMFEAAPIQDELDVYNPLIPDGHNWKATFMIEYGDPEQRRVALTRLVGIEDTVWLQVGELAKIRPHCNEDLDRTHAEKTSAVHFMRFELDPTMIAALKSGASLRAGIDHPHYPSHLDVPAPIRDALILDLH